MNTAQSKQTYNPNESLHNLCRLIITVAVINFGLLIVFTIVMGGDAVNGYEEGGRYYLGGGGNRTEVSYFTFTISTFHVYSLCITHPLGMLALVLYSLTNGKTETVRQSSHSPTVERSASPTHPPTKHKPKTSKMILLEFRDNGTGYEDIVLLFNDEEYLADSYYFVLDQEAGNSKEGVLKIKAVLRLLLEQWLEMVSEPNFQTAYLPYAFYDQCTGWLKCDNHDGIVTIQHGWSDIEGWSFLPSSVKATARAVDDFQADAPAVSMDLDSLQAAIRFSIDNIG